MNSELHAARERLTPDEEARIDGICDRFERAWKKVPRGGPTPCVAKFVADGDLSLSKALLDELTALEKQCRERYQREDRPGALGGITAISPARYVPGHSATQADPSSEWPIIPGMSIVELLG